MCCGSIQPKKQIVNPAVVAQPPAQDLPAPKPYVNASENAQRAAQVIRDKYHQTRFINIG